MPGSELKGTGRAATYPNSNKGYKKGGRIKSEPQTKNVKAEEKRVVGEIKKGYKGGGIIKGNKGMGVAK